VQSAPPAVLPLLAAVVVVVVVVVVGRMAVGRVVVVGSAWAFGAAASRVFAGVCRALPFDRTRRGCRSPTCFGERRF
jgi:hypothetical protein